MKTTIPSFTLNALLLAVLVFGQPVPGAAQENKKTFLEGKPGGSDGKESAPSAFGTPKAVPEKETREAVQVTELGLMRTLVVFNEGMDAALVKIVNQRLSDVHFRVFNAAQKVGAATPESLKELGAKENADLVLYANVTSREKAKMGEFTLFEGEATVEVVSPVSGELLVTHSDRSTGVRKIDTVEAKRSATETVLDKVVKEAATKTLEKSDKLIVYEVEISKVPNNLHVLRIKDHIAKLQGVYHVRDLSYNPGEQLAVLEVIGGPKMLTFIKAHIETMPKMPAASAK
jgi:hypothetical protein